MKVNLELYALFSKTDSTSGLKIYEIKSFNTQNIVITETSEIGYEYDRFKDVIIVKSENFEETGSGWSIEQVEHLELNMNKYVPFKGGYTYRHLPSNIKHTKAVLNIVNNDEACFAWSVVAALYNAKGNVTRTSSYPHYETVLDLRGISFPTPLKQIKKFEENNDLSINVYGLENKKIVGPLHLSSNKSASKPHINLLYVDEYYLDCDGERSKKRKRKNSDDESGDDCDDEDNWSESASDFDDENDRDWLREGDENDDCGESEVDWDKLNEEDDEEDEEEDDEEDAEEDGEGVAEEGELCQEGVVLNEDQYKGHFCLIKNLSRLVSSQINQHQHIHFDSYLIA
ncbi:kinesin-related protein 4-like [Bradysia coprophila]|uniref:kinesin-related protein 4-like n=1 Tax=Bradysia coprophila TaxID=38358 RepID=UPI00187D7199|nr:kinesin-related protein 4-like [Bradysia coprophila]